MSTKSETMRNFEKIAVEKGLTAKSDLKEIVETSSAEKPSFKPTKDIYGDLVRLANGLREKGFVAEAEELENKVFLRKQAETHLYRAFDEDGKDLIMAAHPDGDVEVAPAAEGLGMAETIESTHKKIVDVVNKEPTGKYAFVVEQAKVALGMDKVATDSRLLKAWENFRGKIKPKSEGFLVELISAVNGIGNDPDHLEWINEDIKGLSQKPKDDIVNLVSEKFYNFLYDQTIYNDKDPEDYFNKLTAKVKTDVLSAIKNQNTVDVHSIVHKYMTSEYVGDVKNVEGVKGDEEEQKAVGPLASKLQEYIDYFGKIKAILGKYLSTTSPEKIEAENSWVPKTYNDASAVMSLYKNVKGYVTFNALKYALGSYFNSPNFVEKWKATKNIHSLDYLVNEQVKAIDDFAKKYKISISSRYNKLEKFAPAPTGKAPAQTISQPAPGGTKPVPGGTPSAKASVAKMQVALSELHTTIKRNPEHKFNPQDVTNLLSTQDPNTPRSQSVMDGVWGPNTVRALKSAETIRKEIGEPKTMLHTGQADYAYKPGIAGPRADENTKILYGMITALGGRPGKPGQKKDIALDRIPRGKIDFSKAKQPLMENMANDAIVMSKNLRSLEAVYNFARNIGMIEPQTITTEIVKIKDAYGNEVYEGGEKLEGLYAKTWKDFVGWFRKRASYKNLIEKNKKTAQYLSIAEGLYKRLEMILRQHKGGAKGSDIINPWTGEHKSDIVNPWGDKGPFITLNEIKGLDSRLGNIGAAEEPGEYDFDDAETVKRLLSQIKDKELRKALYYYFFKGGRGKYDPAKREILERKLGRYLAGLEGREIELEGDYEGRRDILKPPIKPTLNLYDKAWWSDKVAPGRWNVDRILDYDTPALIKNVISISGVPKGVRIEDLEEIHPEFREWIKQMSLRDAGGDTGAGFAKAYQNNLMAYGKVIVTLNYLQDLEAEILRVYEEWMRAASEAGNVPEKTFRYVDRYKEKWLNTLNRVKRTLYIGTMPRS